MIFSPLLTSELQFLWTCYKASQICCILPVVISRNPVVIIVVIAKNLPVISSRAGGRKFQKEKETIGRSDALLTFAPDTHVLQWSAIALNARIPPIKLESLLLITFL